MTRLEQLEKDNLRLLNALKVSLDIISGDFHLYDENISANQLIKQVETTNDEHQNRRSN